MKAPLALIGAKLPNGMEIKQAKLRGVESSGMLCSARELGLSEDASGLFDLPADAAGRRRTSSQRSGSDDTIFEVNLTPNRGDCMSVAGVAREVAALRKRAAASAGDEAGRADSRANAFRCASKAAPACPKFVGRVIRGIRPQAKSPFWMQERLRRAGLRPISAVVDVTNYVMLELGQPMHAYDLDKLNGAIIVRYAQRRRDAEAARRSRRRADARHARDRRRAARCSAWPASWAARTPASAMRPRDVFLEAAFFAPSAVAGRGRRYGLITDASQRFERGVDPELQERAIERATQLLLECAGGSAGPLEVTRTAERYPARSRRFACAISASSTCSARKLAADDRRAIA